VDALPREVAPLVDALAAMRGGVAVVLGGSRANGTADAASDWDFTVYYRGALDLAPLEQFGEVHPPGRWGRLMNGGAWLQLGAIEADVMLRDLDAVEHWSQRAREGVYEVDALLGYLAGAPTYLLLAERALGVVLRGSLPPVGLFPERLAAVAPERWRYHRRFHLMHARMRAERGDAVGTAGLAARAIVEEAHAVLCERRAWVLNEKRIVERAGLAELHGLLAGLPRTADGLCDWIARVEASLTDRR
jgi:hypothetical protein